MATMDFAVKISQIEPDRARELWQLSPGATVFTHPQVLSELCAQVDWWLASSQGVPICAWPICINANGQIGAPAFSYYVGPIWLQPREVSPRRRLLLEVVVYHELLNILRARYGALRFSLAPGAHDIRAFLWFAQPMECPPIVNALSRYTACIDLSNASNDEALISGFSYNRRFEARSAARRGAKRVLDCDFSVLDGLYRQLMNDRGQSERYTARYHEIKGLWRLVEQGFGYVIACGNGDSTSVGAAWLVLQGKGRACCVIGATSEPWRTGQLNAYMHHQVLVEAKRQGATVCDFNGANTLMRGSDKHSYGAEAELYFEIQVPA